MTELVLPHRSAGRGIPWIAEAAIALAFAAVGALAYYLFPDDEELCFRIVSWIFIEIFLNSFATP